MEQEKLYQDERVTISKLSMELDYPEYKLRSFISN